MASFGRFRLTASGAPGFVRRLGAAVLWVGAGLGTGYALRFLVIEPEAIGRACVSLDAPSWCLPRQAVIWSFHLNVIGGLGLAAGLVALLGHRRDGWRTLAGRVHARTVALAAGGLALVLYNVGLGAAAVVLGLLAAMDDT